MTAKRKLLWAAFGGALVALLLTLGVFRTQTAANDLGLSAADLAIGRVASLESLRAKTKAVAEAWLAQNQARLKAHFDQPEALRIDYTLSPRLAALGYRSSYYYYCWDIYLACTLPSRPDTPALILQLNDSTPGNTHDVEKLRVIRSYVPDPDKNSEAIQLRE